MISAKHRIIQSETVPFNEITSFVPVSQNTTFSHSTAILPGTSEVRFDAFHLSPDLLHTYIYIYIVEIYGRRPTSNNGQLLMY